MKLKKKTSILKHPTSLRATIPQPIVDLYELKPKDQLEWEIDFTEKEPTITVHIIKKE